MPMRFIGIDGLGEIQAGLATAALSLPMLFMPSVAAWLARGVSPGLISAPRSAGGRRRPGGSARSTSAPSALAAIWPMLLIGAGAGSPWGLMDGLAERGAAERAGMAAGIFSTTRVAGEGIALERQRAVGGLIRHRMEAIDGVSRSPPRRNTWPPAIWPARWH